MDIKQSNRWLPLREEADPAGLGVIRMLTETRVALAMRFTPTPIFDDLQKRHWFEHFADMSHAKLMRNCRALGLPGSNNKSKLIASLVKYYQGRVS